VKRAGGPRTSAKPATFPADLLWEIDHAARLRDRALAKIDAMPPPPPFGGPLRVWGKTNMTPRLSDGWRQHYRAELRDRLERRYRRTTAGLREKLALKILAAGHRSLAAKMHPDVGGSHEAMLCSKRCTLPPCAPCSGRAGQGGDERRSHAVDRTALGAPGAAPPDPATPAARAARGELAHHLGAAHWPDAHRVSPEGAPVPPWAPMTRDRVKRVTATKPRTRARAIRRHRIRNTPCTAECRWPTASRADGSCCGACGTSFAPDATVWRQHFTIYCEGSGHRRKRREVLGAACGACREMGRAGAPLHGASRCHPPRPCLGCGRPCATPVYWQLDANYDVIGNKPPGPALCSRACEIVAARRARIAAKPSRTRSCAVCQTAFTPPRTDGVYCSSRCRQAAYRARRR
jgi:hypothetical protein